MHHVVPDMSLITQDKDMSCWYASGQMLVQWRRRTSRMTEAAHPDPSQVKRWSTLYDQDPGIQNSQIPDFAKDLGLKLVPPMSPTPEALLKWLKEYGPLWVNGKAHITVIAGIRDTMGELEVLVYDPDRAYSNKKQGEWRSLRDWYAFGAHSGRDTTAEVQAVFLYVP